MAKYIRTGESKISLLFTTKNDAVAFRADGSWYFCWREDIPANPIDTYFLLPEEEKEAQKAMDSSIAAGWK